MAVIVDIEQSEPNSDSSTGSSFHYASNHGVKGKATGIDPDEFAAFLSLNTPNGYSIVTDYPEES